MRIGFIGAGGIAGLQLSCLKDRTDVEVAAFADTSKSILEKRQEQYPEAVVYTDYQTMLKREKLDAVSVATPNGLHAKTTIAALKAGCHVLVEKPMAMSVTEARRMQRTAKETKRKLIIGFQYRFDPRTQYLRSEVDAGTIGRVLYGRVQALRRRGIPNWGVFGRKELQGGGPLIDIGVHVLEMAHYTMGSPVPVSATADMFTYIGNKKSDRIQSQWAGWDYKTYSVEDLAVGRIRFDNGAVIHIESAFAAHIKDGTMNFELMGEKGGCSWQDTEIFTDENGYMVDKKPAWLANTDFNVVFKRKMDGFVDHVAHGAPTIAPAEAGVTVQAMLDALYKSAEKGGKEVRISV